MLGTFVSINGELRQKVEGVVPIDDVNFAYGYGVYETLKSRSGVVYFPDMHVTRLLHSARIIGMSHEWTETGLLVALENLVRSNGVADCNIKMLLIGRSGSGADLYIMCLNPLFPKRTDYRDGADAILFDGERLYPQAKSLNMLVSSIAFRKAQSASAYDALLVDRSGHLTEGTRTNLFYTDGITVFTPPAESVLEGVTKLTIQKCLEEQGIAVTERALHRNELKDSHIVAGLWLSSTSTKIMPIGKIDNIHIPISPNIPGYIKTYDAWLDRYKATRPVWV